MMTDRRIPSRALLLVLGFVGTMVALQRAVAVLGFIAITGYSATHTANQVPA